MVIGVPKEIKADEYRVAVIPAGVEELTRRGHTVLIEGSAGAGSGISDEDYRQAGATIVETAREIYERAELIYKVKEPLEPEFALLRHGQVMFTYFHFAASCELAKQVMRSGAVAIAYETIRTQDGRRPLLTPMSEIAGKMSIQEGAKYLERPQEGRGVLLGGVPGVAPAKVTIIGGGVVGTHAAKAAAGLGAQVTILDINLDRLRYLDDIMPKNVVTLMSDAHTLRQAVEEADLVVCAVLVEGARTPVLVTREMVRSMKSGAVIVDAAIDQGGTCETSRPTTHSNPTYIVDGVLHYCVTNMPGAVSRTSTYALANVTLPYAAQLADKGWRQAAKDNPAIRCGLNIVEGLITNRAVANVHRLPFHEIAL